MSVICRRVAKGDTVGLAGSINSLGSKLFEVPSDTLFGLTCTTSLLLSRLSIALGTAIMNVRPNTPSIIARERKVQTHALPIEWALNDL